MLPDLRERFLEGLDTPNTYIEAGLPNIKGDARWQNNCGLTEAGGTGPFYNNLKHFSTALLNVTTTGSYALGFDASRVSSIYRDDITTVQPPAYTVRYYIRAK